MLFAELVVGDLTWLSQGYAETYRGNKTKVLVLLMKAMHVARREKHKPMLNDS